jgi:hypothetical protein
MATQDNGLAAMLFTEGSVWARVGVGYEVRVVTETHYPFEDTVRMKVEGGGKFPLYLLIPQWAKGATTRVGTETAAAQPGKYVRIEREWKPGDVLTVKLPMTPRVKVWDQMKDSVSVYYGPLAFSLKIAEKYNQVDGRANAQSDSGWQPGADPSKWPTYEILPESAWNYGLVQKPKFKVLKKAWPANDDPFSLETTPIEIVTTGKRIPGWGLDENGLVAILPKSPVDVDTKTEEITLVPMGAARLRISSFPQVR